MLLAIQFIMMYLVVTFNTFQFKANHMSLTNVYLKIIFQHLPTVSGVSNHPRVSLPFQAVFCTLYNSPTSLASYDLTSMPSLLIL